MSITKSRSLPKAIEVAIAAVQEKTNPFVRDGDATYCRHDKIVITQSSSGIVTAEFFWRGNLTHTMRTQCDLRAGQTLTLAGLEGRIAIKAL